MQKYTEKEEDPILHTCTYNCGGLISEHDKLSHESDTIAGYL